MKRFIALLLVIVTVFLTVTSCSLPNFSFDESGTTVTIGQWLTMVNDAFGMQSYLEEKPYFKNISSDNPYFETVQIATEWDIVNPKEPLDVSKKLTWEKALITLVNAGNFIPIGSDDKDKINYGLNNFEQLIRRDWLNKNIDYSNAVFLMAVAHKKWVNKRYDQNIEHISYKENVVDLSDIVKTNYDLNDNQVVVSADLVKDVQEGEIYILPSKENALEYDYYKAENITVDGETAYISNSVEDIELEDIADEVKLQGTTIPTAENTILYDGNGNIINSTAIEQVMERQGSPNFQTLDSNIKLDSYTHTFKVGDNNISLTYNFNGGLNMKASVKPADIKIDDNSKIKGEVSFEVSNVAITNDFDYSFWSGLKSAMLKVDYQTKINFGVTYSNQIIDEVVAPEYSNGNGKFLTNLKRAALKDKNGKGAKNIASKKVIRICSLNVYNAGLAKICLDVNLNIAFNGSIYITITQGNTKGVEYRKGNLRFIKSQTDSVAAELKAQIEFTLGVGPGLYMIGLKKQLLGVEVKLGAGVSAVTRVRLGTAEMNLIEEIVITDNPPEDCNSLSKLTVLANIEDIKNIAEGQGRVYDVDVGARVELHTDTCFDISAYKILEFGLTDNSYLAGILGGKVKFKYTVWNNKNARFYCCHVDNDDWANATQCWGSASNQSLCKLKYKPFDKIEETEEATEFTEITQDENIDFGELIVLSDFRGEIGIGGNYYINILQLPKGYSMSDIVYTSENTNIAKVNSQGVVEGISSGSTVIEVKTKDGKNIAVIVIEVIGNNTVEFEGIEL